MKKFALLTIAAMMLSLVGYAGPASAAALTVLKDTMTRQTPSIASDHTIQLVSPTGVAGAATLVVTFQSDFAIPVALDFEDVDLSFDATPDGDCATGNTDLVLAAAPSGTDWGVVDTSTTVLTFTNGSAAVAAGSEICIEVGTNATSGAAGVEQITNPTSSGSFLISFSGSFGDTGSLAIPVVESGGTDSDQVVVTATINSSITHTLSSNACALGSLTPGSATVDTCSYTSAVATNATDGYVSTIAAITDGTNTDLNNDADATQVFGNSDGTVNASQTTASEYGVATSDAGNTITQNADCTDGDDATKTASAVPASAASYASATGPASETTTVCHSAAAGTTNPGTGAYTQTVRLIVTGTF
jgi:hypothetical protein